MGTYVTVPSNNFEAGGIVTKDGVDDTMALMKEYAENFTSQLETAIGNIQSAITDRYNPGSIAYTTKIGDIDGPAFPDRPSFGDLGLNTNYPDAPVSGSLTDYGPLDFSIVAPDAPASLDGEMSWTAKEYSSDMWSVLFNKVHNDIISGGTGLSDAVHSAIVAREQRTRRTNQDRELQRAIDMAGEKGFDLPSGDIAYIISAANKESQIQDQNALDNLTIKDFDLATEAAKFAVTTAAGLEQLLRGTWDRMQTLGLEAKKATWQYIVSAKDTNVKLYLAGWEKEKIRLDALKTKVTAIAEKNTATVQTDKAQADIFLAQIRAITEENQGKIDARKGEADIYGTEVSAIGQQYNALIEKMKGNIEKARLEITALSEEEKNKLQAYTNSVQLASDASKAIASVLAQVVASSLQAINVGISASHHTSESLSEQWGHSESISEGHSYQHDPS